MAEKRKNGIRIYEPEEFEGMRKAGRLPPNVWIILRRM